MSEKRKDNRGRVLHKGSIPIKYVLNGKVSVKLNKPSVKAKAYKTTIKVK